MDTNEQIAALVATKKFTLPPGLTRQHAGRWTDAEVWRLWPTDVADQQAHDLCAAHFARESADQSIWGSRTLARFNGSMGRGDSAAAIAALYEAVT